MSFLKENQQEELANFLAGNSESGVQDNDSQQDRQEPNQNQAANMSSSSASEENTNESGHSVPYSRFKSVVQARNDLRAKVEDYEKQLATLTNSMNAPQQRSSTSNLSAFDELYNQISKEYEEQHDVDERDLKLQRLEKVAYDFEVFQAKQALEQDIAVAQSKYPDVPADVLLAAVVQNPEIDVVDLAERYNTFVSAVREDAIAKYTSQSGQTAHVSTTPAAPPRVGSAPATRNTVGFGDMPSPKNLQEAKTSLMDFLKSNGWK